MSWEHFKGRRGSQSDMSFGDFLAGRGYRIGQHDISQQSTDWDMTDPQEAADRYNEILAQSHRAYEKISRGQDVDISQQSTDWDMTDPQEAADRYNVILAQSHREQIHDRSGGDDMMLDPDLSVCDQIRREQDALNKALWNRLLVPTTSSINLIPDVTRTTPVSSVSKMEHRTIDNKNDDTKRDIHKKEVSLDEETLRARVMSLRRYGQQSGHSNGYTVNTDIENAKRHIQKLELSLDEHRLRTHIRKLEISLAEKKVSMRQRKSKWDRLRARFKSGRPQKHRHESFRHRRRSDGTSQNIGIENLSWKGQKRKRRTSISRAESFN